MKTFTVILLSLLIYSAAFAQSQIGIGINGGVNIPVGDFHKFYSLGYGGNIQLIYDVNNAFILVLTSGYHKWDLDESAYNKKADEQKLNTKFNLDSRFVMFPIYVGIRYYLGAGKHRPFFSLDFGGYSYEFKLNGSYTKSLPDAIGAPVDIPETKKTKTQTALAVGFGYLYRLSKEWYIEVDSKYTVLSSAYTINDPDKIVNPDGVETKYGKTGKLNFVSLKAGINYIF